MQCTRFPSWSLVELLTGGDSPLHWSSAPRARTWATRFLAQRRSGEGTHVEQSGRFPRLVAFDQPDERLDSAGRSDCQHGATNRGPGQGAAQRGQGLLDPADRAALAEQEIVVGTRFKR